MTTSDRVLAVLAEWIVEQGMLPADVYPRLRDYDGKKGALEVYLDADDPVEHEVLRGVDTISGEIVVDVSVDDTTQDERQALLSYIATSYDVDNFMSWANDPSEDRGLLAGEDVKIYDIRITLGGSWGVDGRRQRGRIDWEVVASPMVAI
jgi:hypothetical protein